MVTAPRNWRLYPRFMGKMPFVTLPSEVLRIAGESYRTEWDAKLIELELGKQRAIRGSPWHWETGLEGQAGMEMSDRVAIVLLRKPQQQGGARQLQSSSPVGRGKGKGKQQEERPATPPPQALEPQESDSAHSYISWPQEQENEFRGAHLIVGDILALFRQLVDLGCQCDRLHKAVHELLDDGDDDDNSDLDLVTQRARHDIGELTFEVFAALMRLCVSVDKQRRQEASLAALSETVSMLTAVRLPRMLDLSASCERWHSRAAAVHTQRTAEARLARHFEALAAKTEAQTRRLVLDAEQRLVARQAVAAGRAVDEVEGKVRALVADEVGAAAKELRSRLGEEVLAGLREEMAKQTKVQDEGLKTALDDLHNSLGNAFRQELKNQLHGAETGSLPGQDSARSSWTFWPGRR